MYNNTIDHEHSDILIIDDTPANLQLLSSILKDRGFEVRAVVSGEMGLIAARTIVPDLILLDVKMPEMDGYQVCQELKNDTKLRDIPVVFISSLEETLDKVKAFHVGGVDYITKPFQVEEVIARVETQLALYHVYRQAQQSATQRERERLARDLHDAVNQTLFSVSMEAETLLHQYRINPTIIEPSLQHIFQLSQAALAEMRLLFFELRVETLAKTKLNILLDHLANILTARTNACVSLNAEEIPPLEPQVHTVFYRIAQEALNNIINHAQATNVRIDLTHGGDGVKLVIEDNGTGFCLGKVPADRFGLMNMRERAEIIHANLQIESVPGHGTVIALWWGHGGSQNAR